MNESATQPRYSLEEKRGGLGKWVALGCGCGCSVIIIVGIILAAILIPAATKSTQRAQDWGVKVELSLAVQAADSYRSQGGSYAGMTATKLQGMGVPVQFEDGTAATGSKTGIVYLDAASVGKNGYRMGMVSASGHLFRVTGTAERRVYGESDDGGTTWLSYMWPPGV